MDSGYYTCAHATTRRDFTNLQILTDLYKSLELSLKSHLTSSGLYMGECPLRARGSQLIFFFTCRHEPVSSFPYGSFSVKLKIFWRTFDSRDLVHTFRQRTLTLLKALMLQKRVRYRPEEANTAYERPALDYVLWASPRKIMHIPIFPCHVNARWGPFL